MSTFTQHRPVPCRNTTKEFCDCFTDQTDADTSSLSQLFLCNEHELHQEFPPRVASDTGQSMDSSPRKVKKQRKGSGNILTDEGNKHKKAKRYFRQIPEDDASEGYIHVRARRGQATDSHSLAERVRREKISDRLKLLQSLVPGCDRVAGKIVILDEIIKYVQSLKSQVKFLSKKLAMLSNFGLDLDSSVVRKKQSTDFFDSSYPSFETASPESLQQWLWPGEFQQVDGNLSWDVDDESPMLFNQLHFNSTNIYFH